MTKHGGREPYLVETGFMDPWRQIGEAWITENVFGDATPAEVHVAHLTPDGQDCRDSGGSIALHTIVSRDPLTIRASLACKRCAWHGFITDGKWIPA